jgi:hypothetical protein
MAEQKILTAEQIAAFRRDGFVFVPRFYDASQIARITWWTDAIAKWPEKPGRHMVYTEDSLRKPRRRVIQRIENFVPYHEDFRALFTEGKMIGAASELLDEPAVLFKEKINFKLPGGSGFTPHQDVQAGWRRYAGLHVTVLVGIDAATLVNGCLEMVAGWHDKGMLGEEWNPLQAALVKQMDFVPQPSQPGDALFFDSFVPHRSGPNLTDFQRRMLYVTYNRTSEGDHRARYFADKRGSYPPDIEREPGRTYVFRV